jgi:hypothetical protein
LRIRAATVGGQAAGIILLGAATSGSLIATQLAATVLTTVADAGLRDAHHCERSRPFGDPGLATSILPGLPAAVMLLTYVWTR